MEILPELRLGVVRPPIQTATRVGVDRRLRKFGQAQARPGKADQVRDAHPCVHVPDRFSREHAAGRDHKAGAGLIPDRHRLNGHGLPSARSPEGVFNTERRTRRCSRSVPTRMRRCDTQALRARGAGTLRTLRHSGRNEVRLRRQPASHFFGFAPAQKGVCDAFNRQLAVFEPVLERLVCSSPAPHRSTIDRVPPEFQRGF
jgi:hypothetical protein